MFALWSDISFLFLDSCKISHLLVIKLHLAGVGTYEPGLIVFNLYYHEGRLPLKTTIHRVVDNWNERRGVLYRFNSILETKKHWEKSHIVCVSMGAHMLMRLSKYEFLKIVNRVLSLFVFPVSSSPLHELDTPQIIKWSTFWYSP